MERQIVLNFANYVMKSIQIGKLKCFDYSVSINFPVFMKCEAIFKKQIFCCSWKSLSMDAKISVFWISSYEPEREPKVSD